jgi:two-component system, cell cycle sensor histidine kinase and response regulator CckA
MPFWEIDPEKPKMGTDFHTERTSETYRRMRLRRRLESGRSRNVLVVDDDESVRELIAMVLEADGYTVLRARHAPEALLFNNEFSGSLDLLVTDFSMKPFQNGYELAREVRASRPGIRVIYVSGFVDHNVMQREIDSAESLFLAKPFSPSSLLDSVNKALGIAA